MHSRRGIAAWLARWGDPWSRHCRTAARFRWTFRAKSSATVRCLSRAPVTELLPGGPPSSPMVGNWSAMTVSPHRSGGRDRTLSARFAGWGRPCSAGRAGSRSYFGQGLFVVGPGPGLSDAATHDSPGLPRPFRNGTLTLSIDQAIRPSEFHGSNACAVSRPSTLGTWLRAIAEEQYRHQLPDQNRYCPRQPDNALEGPFRADTWHESGVCRHSHRVVPIRKTRK